MNYPSAPKPAPVLERPRTTLNLQSKLSATNRKSTLPSSSFQTQNRGTASYRASPSLSRLHSLPKRSEPTYLRNTYRSLEPRFTFDSQPPTHLTSYDALRKPERTLYPTRLAQYPSFDAPILNKPRVYTSTRTRLPQKIPGSLPGFLVDKDKHRQDLRERLLHRSERPRTILPKKLTYPVPPSFTNNSIFGNSETRSKPSPAEDNRLRFSNLKPVAGESFMPESYYNTEQRPKPGFLSTVVSKIASFFENGSQSVVHSAQVLNKELEELKELRQQNNEIPGSMETTSHKKTKKDRKERKKDKKSKKKKEKRSHRVLKEKSKLPVKPQAPAKKNVFETLSQAALAEKQAKEKDEQILKLNSKIDTLQTILAGLQNSIQSLQNEKKRKRTFSGLRNSQDLVTLGAHLPSSTPAPEFEREAKRRRLSRELAPDSMDEEADSLPTLNRKSRGESSKGSTSESSFRRSESNSETSSVATSHQQEPLADKLMTPVAQQGDDEFDETRIDQTIARIEESCGSFSPIR